MKTKNKFISYRNDVQTSWYTLSFLIVLTFIVVMELLAQVFSTSYIAPHVYADTIVEEKIDTEANRQEFLAALRFCESSNIDTKKGDGGKSIGPYQFQKPTLEEIVGKKMSYDEYYSIVTDYEKIHTIAYHTYFERGESWRWKHCNNKILKTKTWIF